MAPSSSACAWNADPHSSAVEAFYGRAVASLGGLVGGRPMIRSPVSYSFELIPLCSRIPIHERVELPESLIPADSRVEIDAKITAGEFNTLSYPPCSPQCHKGGRDVLADVVRVYRLLHHWTSDDDRGAGSCTGTALGGVSLPTCLAI